jgi:hypothetical protein
VVKGVEREYTVEYSVPIHRPKLTCLFLLWVIYRHARIHSGLLWSLYSCSEQHTHTVKALVPPPPLLDPHCISILTIDSETRSIIIVCTSILTFHPRRPLNPPLIQSSLNPPSILPQSSFNPPSILLQSSSILTVLGTSVKQ